MSSTDPLKVIVVGGGPVGLTAAHALSRSGINFVLLEGRPTVVVETGCDLIIMPTGLRVLSQLDLYDDLHRIGVPLGQMKKIDHYGRDLGTSNLVLHMGENHGYRPLAVSRHSLTEVLYNGLPLDIRNRLLANKQVAEIVTTVGGVEVKCTDGTSYRGSMVIGADGAHSVTRNSIRKLAMEAGESNINDEHPFLTTYRSIWIRFPTSTTGLKAGDSVETHGQLAATQLFVEQETSVVGFYERLDKPTRERVRYTASDQEVLIKRWAHIPITGNINLEGVYSNRVEAGMTNLEEGVLKHWYYDRIVLVGDAAHKYTPSTGQGCNVGILDVVVLINELCRARGSALATDGPGAMPSKDALSLVFEQYQNQRYESVVAGCDKSGKVTANATWETTFAWLFDRFILSSHMFQRLLADQVAQSIAEAPIFDFIDWIDPVAGKVPWVHPIQDAP